MNRKVITQSLKEASACIRKFESESKSLKEKVAASTETITSLRKEAEALKIAMELVLDEGTMSDITDKVATLQTKDLTVVREAMSLDLTRKTASMGDLYDSSGDSTLDMNNPVHAFLSVLKGNK